MKKTERDFRKAVIDATKPTPPTQFPAKLGNLEGTVQYSGNLVWVTTFEGQELIVKNTVVNNREGIVVMVGTRPGTNTLSVLYKINDNVSLPQSEDTPNSLPLHGTLHQYPNVDTIWVKSAQFIPGLVLPVSNYVVRFYAWDVAKRDSEGFAHFAGSTSVDLEAYVPSGGVCWVLLEVNDSGQMVIEQGTTYGTRAAAESAGIPTPTWPLSHAVLLDDDYGQLERSNDRNDFWDLRFTTSLSFIQLVHAATSKTTPVDADEIPIWDSVTSALKKLTWANLKATLKTYFDTLYVALTGDQTVAGVKTFSSFPVTPSSAPTTNYQVANKKYVDDSGGGGGGGSTFLALNDTPSAYTGSGGKIVVVNSAEDALEFTPYVSPLTTKGDLYTFSSDDARLPVGADGYVLKADSGETTGLLWAAESGNSSGWTAITDTWTRTGNYTFTISGDVTTNPEYQQGVKVRWKDGGSYKYGVIGSASYASPNTTITLVTNDDYAMAAATITDTYYSIFQKPDSWPDWFDFSTTVSIVPVGSMTISSLNVNSCKWKSIGGNTLIYVLDCDFTLGGTASNQIRATLPWTAGATAGVAMYIRSATGGAVYVGTGTISQPNNRLQAGLYDNSNWTLGTGRVIQTTGIYEMA